MVEWAQSFLAGINAMPVWQVSLIFFTSGVLQCTLGFFPGDFVLLIGAGIWTGGFLNDFLPVLLSYWVGATAASLAMTEIGRQFGNFLLTNRWIQKVFSAKAQEKCKSWLHKRGIITLFAAKFVFGMNVPMLLFAGVMKLRRSRIYPAVIVATAVQNTLFYSLGSALGFNWQAVKNFIIQNTAIVAIALALVLGLIVFIRRRAASNTQ